MAEQLGQTRAKEGKLDEEGDLTGQRASAGGGEGSNGGSQDPHLGAKLADAYVRAVQGQGEPLSSPSAHQPTTPRPCAGRWVAGGPTSRVGQCGSPQETGWASR